MSRRASGFVLLLLSVPLLLLAISAWNEANHEAGVRAYQLQQASSADDPRERERFADYAESTLGRQQAAENNRNWMLAVAVLGAVGGLVVLFTRERPAPVSLPHPVTELPPVPASALFRPCRACQWQISVEATACPRCGCPHEPQRAPSPQAAGAMAGPPAPVSRGQRAFYMLLLLLGGGAAVVIYTVLFGSLSETQLVQYTPYWLFPIVFGYYGLVAQRMEARLPTTRLDNVSDQLLNVIKESGPIGQAFAFLVHAPFLLVKSRTPWVVAFVGSVIWAIALTVFFSAIFPEL